MRILQNENIELAFKFCYLAACVFHNKVPDTDNFNNADLGKLYDLSQKHSMTALIYTALEKTAASGLNPQLMAEWKTEREKAVRNNLLFDAERKKLTNFMEKNKIWYTQLKGIVIKALYPGAGLRQMSDNDILFDPQFREKVKTYFESNGYETKSFGNGCHDTYVKKPVYNFELHVMLFEDFYKTELTEYFNKISSRLLSHSENKYEKVFSYEDFYLYFIAHSHKHYYTYGIGIRFLCDLYLILKNYYELTDKNYLNTQLQRLGLSNFEKIARELSIKLFSFPKCLSAVNFTDKELQMFIYISLSGTYGIKSNKVKNQLKLIQQNSNHGLSYVKIKYYQTRLFPDEHWYYVNSPFCFKHKWARPFYTVFRIMRALIFRRNKLKKEYKIINSED